MGEEVTTTAANLEYLNYIAFHTIERGVFEPKKQNYNETNNNRISKSILPNTKKFKKYIIMNNINNIIEAHYNEQEINDFDFYNDFNNNFNNY